MLYSWASSDRYGDRNNAGTGTGMNPLLWHRAEVMGATYLTLRDRHEAQISSDFRGADHPIVFVTASTVLAGHMSFLLDGSPSLQDMKASPG